MSIGTASHIITTRKKKAYRMLPVKSAMIPTINGPKKELDYDEIWLEETSDVLDEENTLSVIEKRPYLPKQDQQVQGRDHRRQCSPSGLLAWWQEFGIKGSRITLERAIDRPLIWSTNDTTVSLMRLTEEDSQAKHFALTGQASELELLLKDAQEAEASISRDHGSHHNQDDKDFQISPRVSSLQYGPDQRANYPGGRGQDTNKDQG